MLDMLDCITNVKSSILLEWGCFALIEFLVSENEKIPKNFKNALDIGSFQGNHTKIMENFGLEVDQIDKYVPSAEINDDFNSYNFSKKYDVVFCSHVIEHQRNVGFFLDKIFDILTNNGVLIITGPKHPAERFVEGHLHSTILPLFLQNLVFAGFDCKKGKILCLGGIENSFIVKKAKNFDKKERQELCYSWTKKHLDRSIINLKPKTYIPNQTIFLENCKFLKLEIVKSTEDNSVINNFGLSLNFPKGYKYKDFLINFHIRSHFQILDSKKKRLCKENSEYVEMKV